MIYILIGIILLMFVIILLNENSIKTNDRYDDKEKFIGALDSLYSNYGAQDRYLTGNRVLGMCDELGCPLNPYDYLGKWNWVPWNIPTRTNNKLIFYPYAYQYFVDQMGKFYPIIVP